MSLVVTSGPSVEPVSLADAKTHLRVSTTASDGYITSLVTVARKHIETTTGRTLINTTMRYTAPALEDRLRLPRSPVSAITSLNLYDEDNDATTVASSVYSVSVESEHVSLVLNDGESWPTLTLRSFDPVEVVLVAGYGSASSDVPEDFVHAIKLLVGHWFETREPIVVGTIVAPVPRTVDALVAPHVIRRF